MWASGATDSAPDYGSGGLVPTERNQSDVVIFRYVSDSKIPMHTLSRSTMSPETGVGIFAD